MFCVFGAGSATQEPSLVGLAADLIGSQGDLGVEARDGALLAVSTINDREGIKGRPIKLIVRNDRGEPKIGRQADAEPVEIGVVAIIGHMTSGQTAAVIDQINNF